MANIDCAKLIPLGELSDRMNELDRERLTIVHCHSGQRSAQAVRLMQEAGFEKVFNLEGGIAKWMDEIDSD
jgi:adenylyltransferase/sulfurtransferase